jgi:hypothetical protein
LQRWRRSLVITIVSLSTLLGLIAFAHTPSGRPLLHWLARNAGCPITLDGGDPIAVEAFRQEQLKRLRGSVAEASRPALGFELGRATRDDVLRWVGGDASCTWAREQTVLRCVDAGLRLRGGEQIADLYLQFNARGVLVAVDAMHAELDLGVARARLRVRKTELDQRVGPATHESGLDNFDALTQGPLRRAAIEYRYRGYVARVSAMHLGRRGVRLREHYQALVEPAGT